MTGAALPWRGPAADRPDLPLPPAPMPLLAHGQLRKRWRYVAAFGEEAMLCAALAEVGPFRQSFWVCWDRVAGRRRAKTSLLPGRHQVTMEGPRVTISGRGFGATIELGECEPVEAVCPSGRGWGWTRKRAGMPAAVTLVAGGERRLMHGRGVDDESAGYHRRETSWLWSAGVGRDGEGRALAWNLVEGINDPPRDSERAIWVDGAPIEPPPASFEGLDRIRVGEDRLDFSPEAERSRSDNLILIRSSYRLRFGTFAGTLAGAPLAEGLGVMERHEALW